MLNTINTKLVNNQLVEIMQACEKIIFSGKKKIISHKKDGSSVTNIDIEVDNYIYKELKNINPNISIISEERKYEVSDFKKNIYWLVDPIDGTRDFIKDGEEYTVNIALIEAGNPTIGIIFHPPTKKIWIGEKNGLTVLDKYTNVKKITKKKTTWKTPKIISSRHTDAETLNYIKKLKTGKILYSSSSIKFCFIAESIANLYFRLSKINKWDIAAGHAILSSIGGVVNNLNGKKIDYNSPTEIINDFVAADISNWREKIIYKR